MQMLLLEYNKNMHLSQNKKIKIVEYDTYFGIVHIYQKRFTSICAFIYLCDINV